MKQSGGGGFGFGQEQLIHIELVDNFLSSQVKISFIPAKEVRISDGTYFSSTF